MKKIASLLFFFLSASILNLFVFAEKATPPLLDEEILKRIQHEVSGSICFEHIRFLSTLNRELGARDHHLAAQYLVEKALEYGLKEAIIEKYPSTSEEKSFWKYILPFGPLWDGRGGDLRLVKPYPQLLSDFESATGTVAPGSHSVDITAEVVFVGRGDSEEAYKDKDVKGKIVLSESGSHMRVHELAVQHFGALGTIWFPSYHGKYPEETEAVVPLPIWPWLEKNKEQTFGFNLSEPKGLFLKELLEKGEKVVVSGRIEAEVIKNGVYELATAVIPGSSNPEEEFIFYAHLDHSKPGAHDNASGCAVLLEIARTLSRLIQKNIIPPPMRTIRFMWIPHMSGLEMYFFHHPEKIGKIKGGCNADCVGVNQAKFPANFHVALPPHSLSTYLTDLTNNLVAHFNEKMIKATHSGPDEDLLFSPEGSRNMFYVHRMFYLGASDEYAANSSPWNIPSLYFYDYPLPPRHSQLNFLDYMDSTNLGRIAYLGAILSYAFAAGGEEMAPKLINEISYQGKIRLERELNLAQKALEESNQENIHQNFAKGKNLLFWGIKRENGIARSLGEMTAKNNYLKLLLSEHLRLLDESLISYSNRLKKYYALKCQSLNLRPPKELRGLGRSPWEKTIPVLSPTMKSLPSFYEKHGYFVDKLGEKYIEKYKALSMEMLFVNKGIHETFNYMDGQNTVADILEAVQAEHWSEGYSARHSLSFEQMSDYLRLLKDAQVIDFKNK